MALHLDLRDLMQRLTPRQRSLVNLMSEGLSVNAAAKRIGVHPSTAYEDLAKIQSLFSALSTM